MLNLSNKTILITGAAGYIGSNLIARLQQDNVGRIIAVDNMLYDQHNVLYNSFHNGNFEFHRKCVTKMDNDLKAFIQRADIIFPLAALVGAPVCDLAPAYSHQVNVEAIRNMLPLLTDQLVIFPTTNSGYGTRISQDVCTEETPLEPISLYGRQKVDAERLIMTYPLAITFRLATVFGVSPRMRLDLLVNDFTYQCFTNRYLEIFEPQFKRNFIHVDDVANAFMFAMYNASSMIGNTFNLGNDSANMTKGELADLIGDVTGAVIEVGTGSDPDKRDYNVSSKKLERYGFKAEIGLREGISDLLQAYQMLPTSSDKRYEISKTMRNTDRGCQKR